MPPAVTNPHMSYFGGPVVSNAHVEDVFWGAGTYGTGAGPGAGDMMPSFFNSVGSSDWFAWLTEYNTDIASGTDQVIGPASSAGEVTITPAPAHDGTTITDGEEQAELIADFNSGSIPPPTLDSHGNVDSVYALFIPDVAKQKLTGPEGSGTGGVQWCSYHNTLLYNGLMVPYMVLPAYLAGTAYATGCGTGPTLFDDFTTVISHELVESVTDPGIGLDTSDAYAYPAAWGDNHTDTEVADACDDGFSATEAGFYVQDLWSNSLNECIYTRPYVNLSPPIASVAAGTPQLYTASGQGGADLTGSTTLSISPNGGTTGASCTGDGCSATQPGLYVVTGTSGGVTGDSVPLTVTAAECTSGFYSATGTAPCTPAPAGTFVASPGSTATTPCLAGTYNPDPGQSSCTPAPAGTFVASPGSTATTPCLAGTYNPDPGQSSCTPAPAGTFVASPGSTATAPCLAGTYNPDPGQSSCTPAPAGTFVASPGSTATTPCLAGTYNPDPGQSGCTPAPVGTYVASTGATAPTSCPPGTTTIGLGATSAAQCVAAPSITSVATSSFTNGVKGTFTVTATGTPTPSITHTGALPSGVTLSAAGVLSGTPKVTGTLPHNYVITITATNGAGTATQKFTLTVLGFHISTTSLPNGTAGKGYPKTTLRSLGGTGTITWKAVSLPKGFTLSSAGVLAGTPNKADRTANYTVSVSASEKIGKVTTTVKKTLTVRIVA